MNKINHFQELIKNKNVEYALNTLKKLLKEIEDKSYVYKRRIIKACIETLNNNYTNHKQLIKNTISKLEIKREVRFNKNELITTEDLTKLQMRLRSKTFLIIDFFLNTGITVTEFQNIQIQDLIEKQNHFLINLHNRNIKVSKTLINKILETFNREKFLFETYNKQYTRQNINSIISIGNKYINKRINPTILRKTYIHECLKNESIKEVAKKVGISHRQIADVFL